MRALRIALSAWVGVLAVCMLVPNLRAHLPGTLDALMHQGKRQNLIRQFPDPGLTDDEKLAHSLDQFVNPWSDSLMKREETAQRLMSYVREHRDEIGPSATLVRTLLRSNGLPMKPLPGTEAFRRAQAESILETSRHMQTLEPSNWFWRMGEILGLMSLDRVPEARKALVREPLPSGFKEYVEFEPDFRAQMARRSFWGLTAMEDTYSRASVLLPHLSQYRNQWTYFQTHGTPTQAESRAWILLGDAMVRESSTLISAIVGRQIIRREVAGEAKPSTKPEPPLFSVQAEGYLNQYAVPTGLAGHIRYIAGTDLHGLYDFVFEEPATGELGYAVMAASIACTLLAAFALIPWRIPTKKWWWSVLLIFGTSLLCTAPVDQTHISPPGWIVRYDFSEWLQPAALTLGIAVVATSCIRKAPERAFRIGAALFLFGLLLFGTTFGHKINPMIWPSLCAGGALLGADDKGRIQPWVAAPMLGILTLAHFTMGAPLPFAIALVVLTLVLTSGRNLASPCLWVGLAFLVGGLGLERSYEGHAHDWLRGDERALARYRQGLK